MLLAAAVAGVLSGAVSTPSAAQAQAPSTTTEEAKLTADDGARADNFGRSVALDGDTAVVGAPSADVGGNDNQGAAYVFVVDGGAWSQQAKLTPSDPASFVSFGDSVAISGDTAVVGAPSADVGGGEGFDQGATYVFVRNGTSWSQQGKLTASDGGEDDKFGRSVAISGDTAVVGNSEESAYVFVRNGTSWSQQAKVTAFDGTARLWKVVAISGDTAVVGSYVFVRNGSSWSQQPKLTASDGTALGFRVAISGDTAVEVGGESAYVFVRTDGVWSQQAQLTASDGVLQDSFGESVGVSGDRVVVGASRADVSVNEQGAAYLFVRSGGSWIQQAKLVASDGGFFDSFGVSVACRPGGG